MATTASLKAYSAYNLPSVKALVLYFHEATGFPYPWHVVKAIRIGFYKSWPGLAYASPAKHCPIAVKIFKSHVVHTKQCVRSTRPRMATIPKAALTPLANIKSNELHIRVQHISKLYTTETGWLPIKLAVRSNI